jgi:hypothetical protein
MEFPAWQVHVFRHGCRIQSGELEPKTWGMGWLNASLRSRTEEPFDSFVAKGLDHSYTVYRYEIQ